MAPKILFVLTSNSVMGITGKPTGWYLPEFAHPYDFLAPLSEITVASPKGGECPLDPASVEMFKSDASSVNFLNTKQELWKNTVTLSSILGHASEYEAIFFVGGHGPVFDLAVDETSHKLINEFHAAGKIVSAVCHGPAALTHVKLTDGSGKFLVEGHEVTGFANTEEDAVGLSNVMPFLLEDQLKAAGGKYSKAADWNPHVVVGANGKLITGQNPASAGPIAKAIYEAIPK